MRIYFNFEINRNKKNYLRMEVGSQKSEKDSNDY
jgi:hypothetical protein